jgi:hypothetical protein
MPIGAQKVDKTFYNDVNQSYMYRITSAIDPINKLVFWAYPSHNSTSGNCDTLLIYNWALSRWATADCNCEMIFRAMTFGYTLDSLDSTGYSLDTLPFSLDSRVWTAGSILLAGFDTTHSLGYFTGTTLAATVETSEIEPAAQDPSLQWKRMLLTNSRPITDGGTPSVSIGVRDREQDAVVYNSPVTVNTYGTCPQRASGRYVRAQINQSAGDAFNHISGVEVIGMPEGIR